MDYIQPARTICIGDIHGCSIALQKIIECVQPGWDDRVVLLGDYVDRGPDTRGVIEQVWKLQECSNVVALQGNHELMLLRAFHDSGQLNAWLQFGGVEKLASYGVGWRVSHQITSIFFVIADPGLKRKHTSLCMPIMTRTCHLVGSRRPCCFGNT